MAIRVVSLPSSNTPVYSSDTVRGGPSATLTDSAAAATSGLASSSIDYISSATDSALDPATNSEKEISGYLKSYYDHRPTEELRQRIKSSDSKVNSLELAIKKAALSPHLSFFEARRLQKRVQHLTPREKEKLDKLLKSLHPKTQKLLTELAQTSPSNVAKSDSGDNSPTSKTAHNRVYRIMSHFSATPEPAAGTVRVVGSAGATPSQPTGPNLTPGDNETYGVLSRLPKDLVSRLLLSPEIMGKVLESSELQKGQELIQEVLAKREKEAPAFDVTRRMEVRHRFVLSIDGGGIRGKIPALVLDYVEQKTQSMCYQLFDLISGTSTGAILACGASVPERGKLPFTAREMVKIYDDNGSKIFGRPWSRYAKSTTVGAVAGVALSWFYGHPNQRYLIQRGLGLGGLGGLALEHFDMSSYLFTKYRRDALQDVVGRYFGNRQLQNCIEHDNRGEKQKVRLLIPTCTTENTRNTKDLVEPLLFDSSFLDSSWTHFSVYGEPELEIRDILLSTTAAPSFFPVFELVSKRGTDKVVDGGVYFNNPALLAYSRAKDLWPRDKIHVLSLGTGRYPGPLKSSGKLFMVATLIDELFQAQSYATDRFLKTLTGEVTTTYKIPDISKGLSAHSLTVQPAGKESWDVQLSYRPLESYLRVDGNLPQKNMDLDSAHLLNPGDDPFTEAAEQFIKEANDEERAAANKRLTFDRFLEKMKNYHSGVS